MNLEWWLLAESLGQGHLCLTRGRVTVSERGGTIFLLVNFLFVTSWGSNFNVHYLISNTSLPELGLYLKYPRVLDNSV